MKTSTFLRSFLRNEQGSVLIIAGLTMLTLVAVSGAAIDLGRQQLLRSKLQQASDAGAVAVATMPEGSTDAQMQQAGERYFMLNFPDGYMGVERPPVSVQTGPDIIVEADVDLPTRFITFVGVDEIRSTGRTRMSSITAKSGGASYDIILSMDVSGSMSISDPPAGPRYIELRNAANAISSNLLNPNSTNSRIAANTWDSSLRAAVDFQDTYGPIQSFLNSHVGANLGTCSSEGMRRAQAQAAGFRQNVVRAVVLLTDGVNSPACNAPTLQICEQFKNDGVVVYTIALGRDVQNNANVRSFLSSCATGAPGTNEGQYFFIAPDGNTLQGVFQQILTSVKSMRILD
jgi:hypothetical protein